jgi:hypothetical protein
MENKRTLWVFGDSYSTPYEDRTIGDWVIPYIEWKGYVPKTFGDVLSKELDITVKHLAKGGLDNDTIFEIIIKSAPLIQKEDIVIIGWSSILRFRLANSGKGFTTIIPNFNVHHTLSFISTNTIEEILVNRSLLGYKNELYDRIKFLNWLFDDMILIQWTPFWNKGIKIWGNKSLSTITSETNNLIVDYHYSELGHKQLTNEFLEMINDDTLRKTNNSICDMDKLI